MAEQINYDAFQNVLFKAQSELVKYVELNRDRYAQEYFSGNKGFTVEVVNGDPKTSTVFVKTTPEVTATNGVTQPTNKMWLELDFGNILEQFGLKVKIV